jgi:ABC-type transport system involved in multi-copper enzyme maturation permease subunit
MLGPIFAREMLTLPRRSRHYVMRTVYFGVLWVLGLTVWQATVGWEVPATLGDLARFGLLQFQILVYVQLTLVLFFAALSAASTITLEKDRRTFVLLLITDLRNYEIVLGKLLGSLLEIMLFLLGTLPIYCLSLLLGGVDGQQILQASVVLAGTALAAGSLGGLVALWRDKTFQSLALTVLFLVLYFCVVHALSLAPLVGERVDFLAQWTTPQNVDRCQRALEPFLALQSVIEPERQAEGASANATPDAYRFGIAMLALSFVLNAWGIYKLRKWNPSGEPIMQRERPQDLDEIDRAKAHAAPGALRRVWANPILWREIATRAYGRRPLMVKAAYFVVLGLVCYYAFAGASAREWAAARGLVPICILSLILISAQAVTAITSERDVGALDLLLVTDLTPMEFIFGKLGGIVYNTKEYLIAPFIMAGVYGYRGLLASASPRLQVDDPEAFRVAAEIMNGQAFAAVLGAGLVVQAFAIVLGLHVALRTPTSRVAVINTLGTVFFLSVGTLICLYLILINGRFEYQWLSFIFFLGAGIGGIWWVLSANRPSKALTIASWLCPLAVYYTVTNVTVGNPLTLESTDPLMPFVVVTGVFGFTIAAMLVPLLSEFDVALGRTTGGGE